MNIRFKKGFTLVELIVVVTILAILSTIGFVSYSSYLSGVRDANRQSQLVALHDGLEMFRTDHTLPLPDDYIRVENSGSVIGYQGFSGKKVLSTIDFTKGGIDPKDKTYFSYYLSKDRKRFQLMSFLENNDNIDVSFFGSDVYAGATDYSSRYATVFGQPIGSIIQDSTKSPIQEVNTIVAAGTFDIGLTAEDYTLIFRDDYSVTGSGGVIGKYIGLSENCKDIKDTSINFTDGYYFIKPQGAEYFFEVYCDMDTKGNARTRFVNIKGDYSLDEARACWGTDVVSSINIDCFNPNKYRLKAIELMLKHNGSDYFFKPKNGEPTTISEKKADTSGSTTYYCYGGNDYMTAMRNDDFPKADGSDATSIWLGKSYCGETLREVGGRTGTGYMNFSSKGTFGPLPGNRSTSADNAEIYIR